MSADHRTEAASPSEEERFDIYDDDMRHIGTAPRSEVHAKGYWHRSFHCWVVRVDGGRVLVRFQRRASGKDTYPDCFDITAAGHLSAGETVRDAAREIREELGLDAPFEALVYLGETRKAFAGEAGGVRFVDREVSDVYGWRNDAPLDAFRLQPEEVAGIYEADARDLIALFEGAVPVLKAAGLELNGETDAMSPAVADVTPAAFVEREPAYYADIFRALLERFAPSSRHSS